MRYPLTRSFRRLICSCLCCVLTGILTALVILFYNICADYAIEFCEKAYHFMKEKPIMLPVALLILSLLAVTFSFIYKKYPDMRGGGIPTSIGTLRGFIRFNWLKNLLGTFFLSIITFAVGVPLGNEGPSVQMGTSIGSGVIRVLPKSQRSLERYLMTGGACAAFSSATGAPISGILFTVEEVYGRFSPLVILLSSVCVFSARIVTELLAPVFGVSVAMFPGLNTEPLPVTKLYIPLIVGAAVGLFSVVFLKYYNLIKSINAKAVKKFNHTAVFIAVFALTVFTGLVSSEFVSTGHELIVSLFDSQHLMPLILILAVRTTLTLSANNAGLTGGTFVPVLTLGALVSAIVSAVMTSLFGLSGEYSVIIILLGISACISSAMKMPLTAIVFAVEALACQNNLLPVITAAVTAFVIAEIFGVHSINEQALEHKLHMINKGKTTEVYDTFVKVQDNSFVEGKQIRDVLWPDSFSVLSVQHDPSFKAQIGQLSEKVLYAGDILHIRYSTNDENATKEQILTLVGQQEYPETQTDNI